MKVYVYVCIKTCKMKQFQTCYKHRLLKLAFRTTDLNILYFIQMKKKLKSMKNTGSKTA